MLEVMWGAARPVALGALLFLGGSSTAASIYKYRDANGTLVYAEQKPGSTTLIETMAVTLESNAPRIAVERTGDAERWQFAAINECLCVVEF